MRMIVSIIVAGSLFAGFAVFASDKILLGHFRSETGLQIEVRPAGVRVAIHERFPFDSEEIMAVHGETASQSPEWSSEKKSQCKAETHVAKRAPSGELVLLRLFKRKASLSGGWLCKTSLRVSAFEEIYAFEQIVLTRTDLGYSWRKLSVWDSPERPKVTQAEIEDPLLLEKNTALKAYVDAEINAGLPKASLSKAIFSPDPALMAPTAPAPRPARE